jgi:hypothetical protein
MNGADWVFVLEEGAFGNVGCFGWSLTGSPDVEVMICNTASIN